MSITALLQSKFVPPVLGGIVFYFTTAFMTVKLVHENAPHAEASETGLAANTRGPSWNFFNPELDQFVSELKQEKDSLSTKERQLNELAMRLNAERAELDEATQSIKRMQAELDKNLASVKADEVTNIKRLAKTYANMEPAAAAKIMRELDDSIVVKIMMVMKEAEAGPILEALAKLGESETKRTARISESLRLAASNKPASK